MSLKATIPQLIDETLIDIFSDGIVLFPTGQDARGVKIVAFRIACIRKQIQHKISVCVWGGEVLRTACPYIVLKSSVVLNPIFQRITE